jgi:hypothetical protein
VVSDQGAAFNHLGSIVGGDHLTVNHSESFVSPEGVNSNTVECANHWLKVFLNRHGTGSTNEACLFRDDAQYMWEAWYSDGTGTMKFGMFFLAIYNGHGFN